MVSEQACVCSLPSRGLLLFVSLLAFDVVACSLSLLAFLVSCSPKLHLFVQACCKAGLALGPSTAPGGCNTPHRHRQCLLPCRPRTLRVHWQLNKCRGCLVLSKHSTVLHKSLDQSSFLACLFSAPCCVSAAGHWGLWLFSIMFSGELYENRKKL